MRKKKNFKIFKLPFGADCARFFRAEARACKTCRAFGANSAAFCRALCA
jgi:hypothetical protein